MKLFRRGRHRATKYSLTVADIRRALLAEICGAR